MVWQAEEIHADTGIDTRTKVKGLGLELHGLEQRDSGSGAGASPVLHEQAGRAGVQQRGQQRRLRQHERGRVVQRAPGQQECVVGQVGRVADLTQAAQPPARLAQQPRQQLACKTLARGNHCPTAPLNSLQARREDDCATKKAVFKISSRPRSRPGYTTSWIARSPRLQGGAVYEKSKSLQTGLACVRHVNPEQARGAKEPNAFPLIVNTESAPVPLAGHLGVPLPWGAPSCGARDAWSPNTLTSSLATYRNALCRVAANQRGSAPASAGTRPAAATP